jgi:hypothetical protein
MSSTETGHCYFSNFTILTENGSVFKLAVSKISLPEFKLNNYLILSSFSRV